MTLMSSCGVGAIVSVSRRALYVSYWDDFVWCRVGRTVLVQKWRRAWVLKCWVWSGVGGGDASSPFEGI